MRTETDKGRAGLYLMFTHHGFYQRMRLLLHLETHSTSVVFTSEHSSVVFLGTCDISILLIIVPIITSMEGWVLKGCVFIRYALRRLRLFIFMRRNNRNINGALMTCNAVFQSQTWINRYTDNLHTVTCRVNFSIIVTGGCTMQKCIT